SEIRKRTRLVIPPLAGLLDHLAPLHRCRSLSAAGDRGTAQCGGSTLGIEVPAERDGRARRDVVEAEDVAELDLGIPVMTVMVLGEDDLEDAREAQAPSGRAPAQLGRVAPPDVELSEQEPGDRSHH